MASTVLAPTLHLCVLIDFVVHGIVRPSFNEFCMNGIEFLAAACKDPKQGIAQSRFQVVSMVLR